MKFTSVLNRRSRRHSAFRTPHSPLRTKLRLERLEDRLALSGFGPQDGSFFDEPFNGRYFAVAIQPSDQKVLAGGQLDNGGNVARYDGQGNVDAAYGTGGLAKVFGSPTDIILQPDGKAVTASGGGATLIINRVTSGGTPDGTFGASGVAKFDVPTTGFEHANAVALQSTGKIVVSGDASCASPATCSYALAARLTISGRIDSGKGGFGDLSTSKPSQPVGYSLDSFGTGGRAIRFMDTAVQPDDKVVAVGGENYGVSNDRLIVARYTKDGAFDTSFNKTGFALLAPPTLPQISATGVDLQRDGKIVVSGTSYDANYAKMLVVRYNANGTLDTSFGSGLGYVQLQVGGNSSGSSQSGRGIALQPDGKIVVFGDQRFNGTGPHSVVVARLNTNGSLDQNFGSGGFKLGSVPTAIAYHEFSPNDMALQADGSIIIAGQDFLAPADLWTDGHPFLMRFSGANNAPAGQQTASATDAALLFLLSDPPTSTNRK